MEEFKKGWKALVACVLGIACGILAVTFYTQGLFVDPVTAEFGWTRGQFFNGFTILMVTGLVTAPIAGTYVDKLGARLVGIIGLVGHAVGYFLISFNNGSVLFWNLSFFLLAFFAAGSLPITWTSIINSWFTKYRGLAIGITMAGSGLLAFIAPPVVELLISEVGWRGAYRALGVGATLISLPVVFFWLRERDVSDDHEQFEDNEQWGITRPEAMRTYKFWALGFALMFMALVIGGLIPNFVPIVTESGISRLEAAGIASMMGLAIMAGRLSVGYLVDRFWAPAVSAVVFLMPIISLLLLSMVTITKPVAVLAAVTLGLAAGASLDLLAYLTSKYFGTLHYGAVFGAIFAFFTLASGIAPNLYGRTYDVVGSYAPILLASSSILLVSIVLFLSLGKYPEKELVDVG